MHLKFSDTSPLKVFAFCPRCRRIGDACRQLVSIVYSSCFNALSEDSKISVAFVDKRGTTTHMSREKLSYKLTFRIDYETWVSLERAARDSGVRPSDWVRELTIETLGKGFGLNPNQRILFEQFVRTQYLVANGFQLLADNKLTAEEWRKFRASAKEKIEVIADRALADFRNRTKSGTRNIRT